MKDLHSQVTIDPSKIEPEGYITPRQRLFADLAFSGMDAALAYDRAYNTKNMKRNEVWVSAIALLNDSPVIRLRLNQLSERLSVVMTDEHERRKSLVLTGLEAIAVDTSQPTPARVKSFELLGKVRGTDLFSDRVETVKGDLTAAQVAAQLGERLAKLGLTPEDLKPKARAMLALPKPSTMLESESIEAGKPAFDESVDTTACAEEVEEHNE